ncbi:META domain-containing protein [Haloechinothrix sp. LS1_15]|uniref:META domain-containing protein n=1 Tax=Haloechinothrix sp. LS1_15 TaxID=2652248 RepID=UPI00294AB35F|nr:META domain-containing protein [Haloechinothrix sp. LS1_15]
MTGSLLALVAATGCGGEDAGGASGSSGAEQLPKDRAYESTEVTRDGEPHELVPGTKIQLRFDHGEVGAHAGCNQLTGQAELRDDRLVIPDIGGTMMACEDELMAQEEWVSEFLTSEPVMSLDGETLVLEGDDTTIEFVESSNAEEDRPLESTRWIVDTVIQGEVASSVPEDAEAYVIFDGDGNASGNGGCNTFGAQYTATDNQLEVTDLTATMMSCGEERDQFERTVFDVLDDNPGYEIEGEELTLTAESEDAQLQLIAD